jgi:type II secretory pathway component PulC
LLAVSYIIYFVVSYQLPSIDQDVPTVNVVDASLVDRVEQENSVSINSRDLFSVNLGSGISSSDLSNMTELPPHLKVVGIMMANQPTVIIEDTKQQRTYFLQQHKTQDGMGIEKIDDQHVYLNVQGSVIAVKRNEYRGVFSTP